jgi:micrococcal nuclease
MTHARARPLLVAVLAVALLLPAACRPSRERPEGASSAIRPSHPSSSAEAGPAVAVGPPSTGPPSSVDGEAAVETNAVVDHVVDGDTIDVRIAGRRERVRLIGINTPETKDPRKPVECYGPEASALTTMLLPPGTAVRLERDAEARDDYGRLLAYVRRRDGLFVNLELARQGAAEVLSIRPNTAYADLIATAVAEARRARRGLWGACPSAP